MSSECRGLIVRMATENPSWGYFRIRRDLLKLGHAVAATTIRSVLLVAGILPSGRRAGLSWKQFLAAHAQTLVAADFLTVDTVFFKRQTAVRTYLLHLATLLKPSTHGAAVVSEVRSFDIGSKRLEPPRSMGRSSY